MVAHLEDQFPASHDLRVKQVSAVKKNTVQAHRPHKSGHNTSLCLEGQDRASEIRFPHARFSLLEVSKDYVRRTVELGCRGNVQACTGEMENRVNAGECGKPLPRPATAFPPALSWKAEPQRKEISHPAPSGE
jgi:hypothetical protein